MKNVNDLKNVNYINTNVQINEKVLSLLFLDMILKNEKNHDKQ